GDAFAAAIEKAPPEHQPQLKRLYQWAKGLEQAQAAQLSSYQGKGRFVLLVHVPGEGAGFVTIWNERSGPALQMWRTVFERLAPDAIRKMETLLGDRIGQGNYAKTITDDLLAALTAVYRASATQRSVKENDGMVSVSAITLREPDPSEQR
ncbi:MAG TPA: hypothetical protein VKT78_07930, partial [Fimbriimonadaceae bacterium]|nr:hypothetical protein [Fimbriimonadaceae bacterium]